LLTSAAELNVIATPPRQVVALVGRSVSQQAICRRPTCYHRHHLIRSGSISSQLRRPNSSKNLNKRCFFHLAVDSLQSENCWGLEPQLFS